MPNAANEELAVGSFRAPERDRLAEIVTEMRRDPNGSRSLLSLSRLAGMSRSNFAEAFRSRFGRSPMEFLRGIRLDHAADLLRNGDIPIKTVVTRCGYGSRASFSQAFSRSFGVSPVEFRKTNEAQLSGDIHAISKRLRGVSCRTQDLAWEVELSTGKVWWSQGTLSALGFAPTAKLMSDVARLYGRIHPKDRDRILASVQSACTDGELTWTACFRFQAADKSYVIIRNGSIILRDRRGAATRFIGVMTIE